MSALQQAMLQARSMHHPNDAELAEAWVAGDKLAGKALVDRYFDEIRAYCVRALGPNGPDVAQKTFLSLVESIHRFEGRASFRTYLYRIARCRVMDRLRARYKEFDPLTHSVEDAGCLSPSRAADEVSRYHQLTRCVDQLTFQSKEVLDLFYWRDLKAREVAAILEINENTVRSRLNTARAQLQRAFDKSSTAPWNDARSIDARLREIYRFYNDGPMNA
jgi:RNA polymerase sigma-70 factor (ECF subfamily)